MDNCFDFFPFLPFVLPPFPAFEPSVSIVRGAISEGGADFNDSSMTASSSVVRVPYSDAVLARGKRAS